MGTVVNEFGRGDKKRRVVTKTELQSNSALSCNSVKG